MITITTDIDIISRGVMPVIHLSQYDSDFTLVFNIYASEGVFTMPAGTTAEIRGTKTDGNGYDASGTVDGTAVTITGNEQMTAVAGKNIFEIALYYNSKRLNTINFVLDVERAALDGDTITSESVLRELDAIVAGATTATEAAGTATAAADRAEAAAATFTTDPTLSVAGRAADAKAVGDEITGLKADLTDITDETCGVNIFSGYTQAGGLNNTTGGETTSSSYVRSDYIPIDTTKDTLYILREAGLWGLRIFFYNSSKTYLSNTQVFNGSATVLTASVSIPSDTAYIRTYRGSSVSSYLEISYTEESTYTAYDAYRVLKDEIVEESNLSSELATKVNNGNDCADIVTDVQTNLLTTKEVNIFDETFPNSGYFDSDGADASSSSYKRTDYIEVDSTNDTLYFLRSTQPYILACCFYDSTKTAVGSRLSAFGASDTALTASESIPNTAAYIRMYIKDADYSGTLMLSYTSESTYVTYGEHYFLADGVVSEVNLDANLQSKVNASFPFYGKTIAFMGDSIVGNFNDSTGLCSIIARNTGATVINCAFGGSRMAYRYGSNIQYTYWNALSGVGLADAIASGTWTDQDTAVSTMTGGLDYFADRLAEIKAIDWSEVDYLLWEYGTNDFMTDVKLTDTSDTTNMYAYDNAYRHAIETILTAYPNIQIIPITPTYRWYQSGGVYTEDSNTYTAEDYAGVSTKLTDFVAMAQQIAREYQLPCIDDYYTMGANRFTRLAFFDSTDGTHPNANGRERIAEHIASQLDTVV